MLRPIACYFKMALSYVLFLLLACAVFTCPIYAASATNTMTTTDLYSDGLIKLSSPEKPLDQDENTYRNPINDRSVISAKFAVATDNEIILVKSEEEVEKIKHRMIATPIYLSSAYKTKIASIVPSLARNNFVPRITHPSAIPKSNAITLAHISRSVWDLNNYKVKIPSMPVVDVLQSPINSETLYLAVATCMLLIYLLAQLQFERPVLADKKNLRRRRSIWRSDFPLSAITYKVLFTFKNPSQNALFGGLNIPHELEKNKVLNRVPFNSKPELFTVPMMGPIKSEGWVQSKVNDFYLTGQLYNMPHKFSKQLSPQGFWVSKPTRRTLLVRY